MAWTKNLGKIKGEDGDTYLPDIQIKDGKLYFTWEKKTQDQVAQILEQGKEINIPIYVPEIELDENNNPTGFINFVLTQPVKGVDNQYLTATKRFYAKGEKGNNGDVSFRIQHFIENDVHNISNPQPNTIYIQNKKAWFYDTTEQDFFMLEGLDLSNYYNMQQTYNKNEIDSMFNEVTSQMELAYRLLEIEETILSNEELGE